MKKILMMGLFTIFLLASCSLNETSNTSNNPNPTTNNPTTPTTINKPIINSEVKVTHNPTALVNLTAAESELYYHDLFDLNNKIEINIDISNEELKKINDDYMRNTYREANMMTFTISYPSGGKAICEVPSVGIRMKGNTSRTSFLNNNEIYNNVHYTISFDETFDDEEEYLPNEIKAWTDTNLRKERKNRTVFGLSKIEIKFNREGDASYSRDIYASQVYKNNNILAQKMTLGEVKFKNQTLGEGVSTLYKIYEAVDSNFIKRYVASDNSNGDLYKATYGKVSGMPTLNQTNSNAYGVDTTIYKDQQPMSYDLKTNKKKSTHEMMKRFLGYINSNSSDLSSTLMDYMDEEYFYTFMAIEYLTGDWDNFLYDSNNYYLYFSDAGLAYFIPYDMDRCFGIQAKVHDMVNKNITDSWNLQGNKNRSNLLLKTIFKNGSEAQKKFIAKVKEIAPSILNFDSFKNNVYNFIYNNYNDIEDINLGNNPEEMNNSPESYFTKKLIVVNK